MYESNTILELKEPRPDVKIPKKEDPDTGRVRPAHTLPFPYNKVRVIGRSPVDHSGGAQGTWSGAAATGVIIEPLSGFASTLDEPFGKLQKLYKVIEVPSNEVEVVPIRVIRSDLTTSAGPTPEDVFAEKAPGKPPEEGQIRARTGVSPLGEVEADNAPRSPLGD